MQPEGTHLRVGHTGADVQAVQDQLTQLGYRIPAEERNSRTFGLGTARAVAAFQGTQGLTDDAVVGPLTAAALTRAVGGQLTRQVATGAAGRAEPAAEPVPGRTVGTAPVPPPRIPSGSGPPGPDDPPPPGPRQPDGWRLTGRLLTEHGNPAPGTTLRLYRPRVGGADLLAETVTGPEGEFGFDTALTDQRPMLDLRAVTPDGTELRLLGAGERIDVTRPVRLAAPADRLPTPEPEYRRVSAALARHLGDLPLSELAEDDERRDLTLLADATRLDARLIALDVTAEQVATTIGLDPQAAYGLLRAGLPADPVQLGRISRVGAGHALRAAVDAGIVALGEAEIESALDTLERYGVRLRRTLAMAGTPSSYGSLLKATGLPAEQQDRFDELFAAHTGDAATLWQRAAEAGLPADRLRLTAQLSGLTLNNARLVESLVDQVGEPDRLASTLVGDQLYRPERWRARLDALARGNERVLDAMIPPAYQGDTVAQRADRYAQHLAYQVRRSFPTHVTADLVRTGDVPVVADGVTGAQVAGVLERAARNGFDLGRTPLSRFLATHGDEVFAGLSASQTAAATAELRDLYRAFQLTASDQAMAALRRAGLRSAQQISSLPERTFLQRYGDAFPSRTEAALTWRRAQQISAVTMNLVAGAKQLGSLQLVPAIAAAAADLAQWLGELVKQFPTLEELFGGLDFCECQHCRSVLSPAAYLVDLLKFLDDAGGDPGPYQVLTSRRPDLPLLPLTCENTHTALPYIDVVNEILELFLVHNGDLAPGGTTYDTGDADSADLLAEPRHLLPAAYDLLRSARYPVTAPFDLWLATVRAFTDHFATPFWQVLSALRASDALHGDGAAGYGHAEVAYERLGFGPAERAVLTAAAPLAGWPALYGGPADPEATLARAKQLARALQVSYHELVDLLRTRFVNPDGDLVLVDESGGSDPCDWDHTVLRRTDGPARPIDLVLLNYLVRVWRRLGWSIEDTDRALVTFLPPEPDPRTPAGLGPAMATALLGMARLQELADLLGAGPSGRADLLALWGPLPETRYRQMFLSGTEETRDEAFLAGPAGYLTTPGVALADHAETVQAGLQLTSDELRTILADAGMSLDDAPLTMETVSLLHRYRLLAKMLKVSVTDLVTLKDLTGLDPFHPLADAPVTTLDDDHPYRSTIGFVTAVRELLATGLSVADLDFLLRHRFDPVGPYRWAADPPLALVRDLTREITRIRSEHAVPTAPLTFTDEVIARSLALVLDGAVVQEFMAAWTGAQPLPEQTFEEHLRRQHLPGVGEVGFLDDGAGLETLFTPTPHDQAAEADRRARLAGAFLPYLQRLLVRRAVVELVAADRGADPQLVTALLTNPALLADPDQPDQPLLDAYAAAGTHGLTTGDGLLTGYLEVPASGGYQFSAVCAAAGTTVELSFDHLDEPVLAATSTDDDPAPATDVELRAGTVYGFTLTYPAGAGVELRVRGVEQTAVPVSALVTYPRAEVTALHRRHLLLAKVLGVADGVGVTGVELPHLLVALREPGTPDLSTLPTAAEPAPDPATYRATCGLVRRLAAHASLRDELAADPADLVALLAGASRSVPEGADPDTVAAQVWADATAALAALTRREPAAVATAAGLLGLSATVDGDRAVAGGFTDERGLTRIWRVLSLATRMGVDPAALGRWATAAPDHEVARDVRDTVKAVYPTDLWRRVAQPIFDSLRRQRRDALVAQVLQVTGYERVEQLFDHFLVDPGTEPVVQTSRLRLAIASVQTFIQRCLLNLEPDVPPSTINADHWSWMQRYRVWEANRKIFLWPENWLEPEWRDDKTHLFTALEAELVGGGDLDRHTVEKALFGYLGGLEEIAHLDVRAIYRQAKPDPSGDVLHVVARTATLPHKYFYRTWSHRSWTPWQPVTVDIDGDHLAAVVWQDRLHLFWVTFRPQTEQDTRKGADAGTALSGVTVAQLEGMRPRRQVEVTLSWSALFQGEWSEPALVEAEQPVVVQVPASFRAADEFLWARVISGETVELNILGEVHVALHLRSRFAPPTKVPPQNPLEPPYLRSGDLPLLRSGPGRWKGSGRLGVHVQGETIVGDTSQPCDLVQPVLSTAPTPYHLVIVPPPVLSKVAEKGKVDRPEYPADDPFFYRDRDHTFFVEPDWHDFAIPQLDQAVMAQSPVWHDFDPPERWQVVRPVPAFPLPHPLPGELLDPPLVAGPLVNPPPVPGPLVDPPVAAGPVVDLPPAAGPVVDLPPVAGPLTGRPGVPTDPVRQPGAVLTFHGRPIGADGLLADPGRLVRTGPSGALVSAELTERAERAARARLREERR